MTSRWFGWTALGVGIIVFAVVLANPDWWSGLLAAMFPEQRQVLYTRSSLSQLTLEHLGLVGLSSGLTVLLGLPLGIWVTRRSGLDFQPIVTNLLSVGQTFPPVAVLALAVPVLGFGLEPTVFALFLYGLLPVVRNTIAGINAVPAAAVDAARGLGMSRFQVLFRVELPLSARVILAGIRISVIINIGTAMIGAVIGAGGLGAPVVAGLAQDNVAYILQGVVPAAVLAVIVDRVLSGIENLYEYGPRRSELPARETIVRRMAG
ncbi:binding-protein-dependent transport systems inner membrane component [Dehalogenimonas lykanthroporepellens BL-DC-9]|jgi:osmoprotectant transport system permease protein|nr:binding-protein-dependent transport systems inner membrane component [Dehalogenimonas lykanthroporepellens BL-DC-9]